MARLCVGIDLGTTFSVVAVCRRGRVEVIANDSGSRTTPSVVGFLDGEEFVGEAAKDLPPEQQIFDVKRLLGRTAAEVQEDAKDWPFKVVRQGGVLTVWLAQGDVKALQPVEVLAMMVKSLKESAEMFLAQTVPCAVLTVPPYFTATQREAIKAAGEWAGLEVLQLQSEPEAVAEAYGLPADKSVLVLHVGGRSAYAWARPAQQQQQPAVCEHLDWGGSLLDQRLVDHCLKDIASRHGVGALEAASLLELRAACEAAKRKLSSMPEATLSVYLSRHNLQYRTSVSRALFEDLCADLFGKIMGLAKKAVASAKVDAVDAVVLVGGSTRIHRLRSLVRAAFGRELKVSVTPDEAAAHGAALRGAALCGDKPATVELRQEEEDGSTSSTQGQGASGGSSSGTSGGSSSGGSSGAHGGAKTKQTKQTSGSGSKGGREAPAVGIDLGTTFSVVAVCRKGRVEVIANDSGSRTTPSIVGFLDGASYVGEAAKDLPAEQRVFDAKRLIGRPWGDPSIQADMKHWPFEVLGRGGVPRIRINLPGVTETFAPEEISAMVLRSLKETAESFLGTKVSKAVITVPAYFNERQRQATMEAGKIAGLEVLSIINEPTSAAIAYGLDKKSSARKTIFIFDLGGGTFDVSVMTIEGRDFTVLASGGDTHLGGQDFDVRLMEHIKTDMLARHGVGELDKQATQDLRAACELAKRKLSAVAEASVSLYSSRDGVRFATSVSRACFEGLCADLFQKTMDITEAVLRDANVSRDAIDEVVLVGGSTRIPKVRSMLTAFFGGKGLRHSINPDEAVAYGAAVQAAVLSGDKFFDNLVTLKDVTPLSLGIELVGGRFSAIIPKNSAVPCKRTKRYTTAADLQEFIPIDVFQGERPLVKDNHDLDKMFCIEVPPKPAGETSVDVTFEIDADGLLTVTCEDPSSARKAEIKINQKDSQRSEKEIQEMIEKAKRFRRQDEDELKQVEETLRQQRLI